MIAANQGKHPTEHGFVTRLRRARIRGSGRPLRGRARRQRAIVRREGPSDAGRRPDYRALFHFAHSFSVMNNRKGGTFRALAILTSVPDRNPC